MSTPCPLICGKVVGEIQSNLSIKDFEENLKMCPLYTGSNYKHYSVEKMKLSFIDSDYLYRGVL